MPDLATDLTLDAIAPDDESALRAWFDLESDARSHDVPAGPPRCWVSARARLSAPRGGVDAAAWLARAGSDVVGAAVLELPNLDNLDNAMGEVVVAPAARRRGIGTRLLAHLTDAARAADRRHLIVEAMEPIDGGGPGAAFLAAVGAHKALGDLRRRLVVADLDDDALARLDAKARAAAAGYEALSWSGGTPEEWTDGVAALLGRMATDVPLGDLHITPERWDAQRVRTRDAGIAARGETRTATVARSAEGELVAYTEIFGTATVVGHAHQGDTIVTPAHRGHRLGMLVKLANLAWLRTAFPAVAAIDTYNAESNSYMVSINEEMGFRPLDRLGEWELEL